MHNIYKLDYDEKISKKIIMDDIIEIAEREGDGYSSEIKWHYIEPLKDRSEAEEFIKNYDNGWYSDHAVRYYDYSSVAYTKKMKEIDEKRKKLIEAKNKYKEEHSIHSFVVDYIGCKECGSKLKREKIRGEHCPLCSTDLRGKTTVEKIKWYDDKIDECLHKIDDEKKKQEKSAKIKWLVKFEFHS